MGHFSFYILLYISFGLFTLSASQLQSSQVIALLQIRKQLEYPLQLEAWSTQKENICYLTPSLNMKVTCSNNSVIELRIIGEKPSKLNTFDGYPIPTQTLSSSFSMDSFVTTLTRLTTLRVLSLVSLGIWGPLSYKLHRLTSLEYLDLSSNFIYGSIPPRIRAMSALRSLILDGNFLNCTVEDWLAPFPRMEVISLTNNQLKGPLPSSIRRISTLTILALSNNEISGKVPDLSGLKRLKVLDLSGNKVGFELPKLPSELIMAFLSNNSFIGEIPRGFDHLNQLKHLDLSLNQLEGKIPTKIFSLPNISYLNLGSNSLSGSLPYHLKCGSKLRFVDISNNRISGAVPKCLNKRVSNFFWNCLKFDVHQQHPRSYCVGKAHLGRKRSRIKRWVLLVSVIGVIALVISAVGLFVMFRRYFPMGCSKKNLIHNQVEESPTTGATLELLANPRLVSQEAKSGGVLTMPSFRIFLVEELKKATNNFDRSSFMGQGSNGKMYKGKLENGTQVAIRCLSLSHKFAIRNLKVRLDLLAWIRHPHLVSLIGHCIDYDSGTSEASNINGVYLVYECAPNGNLRSYLHGTNNEIGEVNWLERLTYLVDIAKAVNFLHNGVIPGFASNRLKLHNILLDENRRAKLSDYGLSVISVDNEGSMVPVESRSREMTVLDDDIFSFGFILLESIVGTPESTNKDKILLKEMTSLGTQEGRRSMVNPVVLSTACEESLSIVITVINKCLSCDSSTRPSFEDVVCNLQFAAQVQATYDQLIES